MGARGPAHFADHTQNLPDEPLTAIAVDPFDDQVIFVGLDGFVFRSDDGGESWAPILSFPRGLADDGALNDTAVESFDGVAAGQSVDALQDGAGGSQAASSDAGDEADPFNDPPEDGEDSNDVLPQGDVVSGLDAADDPVDIVDTTVPARVDAGVRAFAFVPGSRGVFLVATSRGLFRTITGGTSFERLNVPGSVRENDIRDVVVDPATPSRLWLGTGAGLMVSPDGGASFTTVADRPGRVPITDIAVDATESVPNLIIGTEHGLLRSRDGGETFKDMLLRGSVAFPSIHSVAWSRETDTVFAGTGDGLFVAVRGASILERYEGMPDSPPSAISTDPLWAGGVAVAVRGAAGGVLFSDDAGLTVVNVDVLPANIPVAMARETKDPTRLWVACERGVFRLEPGTGIRVNRDAMTALRARFAAEPDVNVVTERALQAHGYLRDDADLRARASMAAWLPKVQARYDVYTGDATQTRNTVIFRDPSTLPPILDPDQDNFDLFGDGLLIISPSQAVRHQFFLTLVWDLDRLVLNPDVLRSARQVPLLQSAERRLVDRTHQLYVARRRLVAELMTTPAVSLSPRERVNRELRLLELEGQLAGLTNDDLFARSTTPQEAP
jgi:photosystem II stability/assembly factor-like uncharacterized protein